MAARPAGPVFLPGESQGQRSLVSCHLWSCTESDTPPLTSTASEKVASAAAAAAQSRDCAKGPRGLRVTRLCVSVPCGAQQADTTDNNGVKWPNVLRSGPGGCVLPSAYTWFPPQKHLSVMGLVISQKYKPETGFSLGTTGSYYPVSSRTMSLRMI